MIWAIDSNVLTIKLAGISINQLNGDILPLEITLNSIAPNNIFGPYSFNFIKIFLSYFNMKFPNICPPSKGYIGIKLNKPR